MICQLADMCQQAREKKGDIEEEEEEEDERRGEEHRRGSTSVSFSAEMRNHYSISHLSTSLLGGGEEGRDSGISSLLNTQEEEEEGEDCKWPPEEKPTEERND